MAITAAFITHSAQRSGAELFVARVCSALDAVHPIVVLGEHGPLEQVLRERGIEYVVIPLGDAAARVRATGATAGGALQAAAHTVRIVIRLRRWLRTRGVDVVATHSAKAHLYGAAAARAAGIPVVAHAHDLLGVAGSARLGTVVLSAAYRFLPREVIANSMTTLASLPPVVRTRSTVIGCPADVAVSTPTRPGFRRFLLVGRLAEWKGQDVAVRALAAARAKGLDPDVELTIVGAALFEGDHTYGEHLHALVRRLGLEDVVHFRGHVDDVAAEYAGADAVLHTSRRPEPFGQVVVEAMASGRPVIATDAGGPAEIVTDSLDGVLTPPGDVDALAAAMLRVAGDGALRELLVRAGHETVRAYSPQRIAARIEHVLSRVARRG